ncbi:MAG TPA: universal stress protein [Sphingobium sp.]|nr:universal stress protein [Sphingobium sp.]
MKEILLLVHDDEGQDARLRAALDLARGLDGHLACVDVSLFPVLAGDYYPGDGVAQAVLLTEEETREARNKAVLETRLAKEGVAWAWADVTGDFAEAVCQAATLADIIVLNRKLDRFPYPDMRGLAGDVLTRARTPVLAVPDSLTELRLNRALIAWDGRASCAATMRACVPVLKLADAVEIFMVRDRDEAVSPMAAAAYLSHHGIEASIRVLDTGPHDIDQHIATHADLIQADYILMGAYGHGRLRETFGGVTKNLLSNAQRPLILGH